MFKVQAKVLGSSWLDDINPYHLSLLSAIQEGRFLLRALQLITLVYPGKTQVRVIDTFDDAVVWMSLVA